MLDLALLAPERPRRIRREEYQALVERGFFDEQRVELLDGVIVEMTSGDPPHAGPIEVLTEIFVSKLVGRARVRVQLDYLAAGESQPVPDIAIVPLGKPSQRHPDRAYAIIEVAVSSLRKDRLLKAPLYAASNVEEYWIVDVTERCFEVFRDADGHMYRSVVRYGAEDRVRLLTFPDVSVLVGDVFE